MFKPRFTSLLIAGGLALIMAVSATAEDREAHRVVIIDEDGQKATLSLDGSRLTVTTDSSAQEIDLDEVMALVDDGMAGAMAGVKAALASLAGSDFRIRMEPEGRVVLAMDGDSTTIDVADALGDEELEQEIERLRDEIRQLRADLDQAELGAGRVSEDGQR